MARRRGNGEGNIRQRPNGSWEGRLEYEDVTTGARKRLSVYGATPTVVRAKLRQARERIEAGSPARDSSMSVAAWCEHWIAATLQASSRRDSTKALCESLLRKHVMAAALGGVPLDRLRPSHFDAWVIELRNRTRRTKTVQGTWTQSRALADSSIARCFRVLRLALDGAVRDGLLARNPMRQVEQPTAEKKESRFLSPAEIQAILAEAQGTRYYALFALIAATGLRKGEASALRWQDVDFEAGTVVVRGTLARRKEGGLALAPTKTRSSRRTLVPAQAVMTMLRTQHASQAKDRLAAGELWRDTGLVFATERGGPLDPRNVLRAFQTCAAKAGVMGASVHTLRHSAATAMLDAGIHLKAVSEILGHAGTQITADTYSHTTTPTTRRAMDALGGALGL